MSNIEQITTAIRDIPDFPKPGILFRDITPILGDGKLFKQVVDAFVEHYRSMKIERIMAVEARGFIIGAAVAYALGVGIVPVRKKGKLPWRTIGAKYNLEYGDDMLEIHEDSVTAGQRVAIIDDVLATGGTAAATVALAQKLGANVVDVGFLLELVGLKGHEKLAAPAFCLIKL